MLLSELESQGDTHAHTHTRTHTYTRTRAHTHTHASGTSPGCGWVLQGRAGVALVSWKEAQMGRVWT